MNKFMEGVVELMPITDEGVYLMNKLKACQAVIDQERYISNHDYSPYDRPTSRSNGSEAVRQADIAYLNKLKRVAGMI